MNSEQEYNMYEAYGLSCFETVVKKELPPQAKPRVPRAGVPSRQGVGARVGWWWWWGVRGWESELAGVK